MEIIVKITDKPIQPESSPQGNNNIGAIVEFRGVVRKVENGKAISAIKYEAYNPMAEQTMIKVLQRLSRDYPCEFVKVVHRIGVVPVGEPAIVVQVGAIHRAEAFGMLSAFMDELKRDVPIWKTEVFYI